MKRNSIGSLERVAQPRNNLMLFIYIYIYILADVHWHPLSKCEETIEQNMISQRVFDCIAQDSDQVNVPVLSQLCWLFMIIYYSVVLQNIYIYTYIYTQPHNRCLNTTEHPWTTSYLGDVCFSSVFSLNEPNCTAGGSFPFSLLWNAYSERIFVGSWSWRKHQVNKRKYPCVRTHMRVS